MSPYEYSRRRPSALLGLILAAAAMGGLAQLSSGQPPAFTPETEAEKARRLRYDAERIEAAKKKRERKAAKKALLK